MVNATFKLIIETICKNENKIKGKFFPLNFYFGQKKLKVFVCFLFQLWNRRSWLFRTQTHRAFSVIFSPTLAFSTTTLASSTPHSSFTIKEIQCKNANKILVQWSFTWKLVENKQNHSPNRKKPYNLFSFVVVSLVSFF